MAASMVKISSLTNFLTKSNSTRLLQKIYRNKQYCRHISSAEAPEPQALPDELETFEEKESVIERLRNFSNLPQYLQDKEHGKLPDRERLEQMTFKDNTKRKIFLRKLYAKYGSAIDIDAGVCWPSKEELEEIKEDDKFFEPSFQQMLADLKEEKRKEAEFNMNVLTKVEKGMAKMDTLIKDFNARQQKELEKEEEAEIKRKEMMELAEEYYGYAVKPRSPEFIKFMEMKRNEEKVAKKAAKQASRNKRSSPQVQQEVAKS
ncbi:growth arrest and DNA damage-inducible proteins-interacting protein 1-like [Mytilus californianus]|uniref:growth arrest and DNA damage-inducible proteins-interacting protein 1-like n=1 Tax=Mytilus californianus TaxID=6549 RepID=UPI002247D050|nr:growth arrest and DNA damage-inducible proteins-interacting protein 1-like [Mytilus californianus]